MYFNYVRIVQCVISCLFIQSFPFYLSYGWLFKHLVERKLNQLLLNGAEA